MMLSSQNSRALTLGMLAVIGAAFLWGVDGVFLRPQLFTLPIALVVFIEHFFGMLVLAPFLFTYTYELTELTRKHWLALVGVAIFGGVLASAFFTKALFLTDFKDVTTVLLLQKFVPLFTLAISAVLLRERFPAQFYLYVGVALLGGYLITFPNPFTFIALQSVPGLVSVFSLLAASAWGAATVLGKYVLQKINYGLMAALRYTFTALLMFVPALYYTPHFGIIQPRQWGVFIAMIFSTSAAAMYLYCFGLKKIPASLAALGELAWPVAVVLFGRFIYHQPFAWSQLFGAVLLTGAVTMATILNKPRTLTGVVMGGNNLGGKTGAPTANLDVGLAGSLPQGLYTCRVVVDRETYRGLLYYGFNYLSQTLCLEVHLLDFSGDLYGKKIIVTTDHYLRFPKMFNSIETLAAQIKKDLVVAKKSF